MDIKAIKQRKKYVPDYYIVQQITCNYHWDYCYEYTLKMGYGSKWSTTKTKKIFVKEKKRYLQMTIIWKKCFLHVTFTFHSFTLAYTKYNEYIFQT